MIIKTVNDQSFRKYGCTLKGYDFSQLINALNETPKPENGFEYKASVSILENLPVFEELMNRGFGGLPIQIGYCNGTNHIVNCLEYHRSSELIVFAEDAILLLGSRCDIQDNQYDINNIEVFEVLRGVGIELFATTLHYAPCDRALNKGYRAAIILPKGTNFEKPLIKGNSGEDTLMVGCNKWLLVNTDSIEAKNGAHIGLFEDTIDIRNFI